MPDLVLVTGATGAVGPAVVRACLSAGYSVRTLSIDAPPEGLLPAAIDVRVGDVCDSETVRAAVRGAHLVVHLAALLHQFGNIASRDGEYERINVGGTERLVRGSVAEGVRRVVYLSTVAVYGSSAGTVIDETAVPRPDTPYSRTKLQAERMVLSARGVGGAPIGTVLRSAAVYGTRVKGNYRRLAEAVVRHRFVPVGRGLNRRTLVYDSDLARAMVIAAEHRDAAGAIFNVTDGSVHTLADIVASIYRALGRRPPRLHVPIGAIRTAAAACEFAWRSVGLDPPLSRTLVEKYTEDVAVDGGLITSRLGFKPLIELDSGWRQTMAALRLAVRA